MELNIRRLRAEDAASLVSLRREALEADPLAFGASPEDDHFSLEAARSSLADHQEQAVFGSLEDNDLTGMVGVIRASKVKQRHTGMVWGMYVTPRARHKGVGRALLEAAIQHARDWGLEQLQLGVTEAAPIAKRLYETAGFRSWGREPRALHWNGRFVDEHHLVLELREPARAAQQQTGAHRLDASRSA
jgi:GNAT superfamily N-acetyltransferase